MYRRGWRGTQTILRDFTVLFSSPRTRNKMHTTAFPVDVIFYLEKITVIIIQKIIAYRRVVLFIGIRSIEN
jgi:hypothetical protein